MIGVIGTASLFPQYESWGWNSSCQPWQLGTLPPEPSLWLYTVDWKDDKSWRAWTTRGMTHWVCGFGWSLQCELGVRAGVRSQYRSSLERNTGKCISPGQTHATFYLHMGTIFKSTPGPQFLPHGRDKSLIHTCGSSPNSVTFIPLPTSPSPEMSVFK